MHELKSVWEFRCFRSLGKSFSSDDETFMMIKFRYKDDVLLKEDDRLTFYSDEDGFFALTIDPVQVSPI